MNVITTAPVPYVATKINLAFHIAHNTGGMKLINLRRWRIKKRCIPFTWWNMAILPSYSDLNTLHGDAFL